MFEWFKKLFVEKKEMVTLRKIRPMFQTLDKEWHYGITFDWCDVAEEDIEECLGYEIKKDGYIIDQDSRILRSLHCIKTIKFETVKEKTVLLSNSDKEDYWFYSDEEVERMQEVNINKGV